MHDWSFRGFLAAVLIAGACTASSASNTNQSEVNTSTAGSAGTSTGGAGIAGSSSATAGAPTAGGSSGQGGAPGEGGCMWPGYGGDGLGIYPRRECPPAPPEVGSDCDADADTELSWACPYSIPDCGLTAYFCSKAGWQRDCDPCPPDAPLEQAPCKTRCTICRYAPPACQGDASGVAFQCLHDRWRIDRSDPGSCSDAAP
jgi:hypothetical protein